MGIDDRFNRPDRTLQGPAGTGHRPGRNWLMLLCLIATPAIAAPPIIDAGPGDIDGLVAHIEWLSDELTVTLSPRPDRAPPNDHPATLDVEALAASFGRVAVTDNGNAPQHLIPPARRAAFADAVGRGLARAGPDQDIVFDFLVTRRTGLLASQRYRTTGRVFRTGDGINLIIGAAQQPYREGTDRALQPMAPARRDTAGMLKVALQPEEPTRLAAGRDDWVILPAVNAPTTPAPTPTAATSPPASSDETAGVRARLELLRDLHRDGLISDDVRDQRTRAILDELER
ncbi:hypothetical protein RM531_14180 [Salinisphaera sp. P385]|uniref:SHOCT domain-containing protein n=1 Tax=Spectribacter acetivorans TaxID=3075603 RepID=A0ABU3BCU7_9GAMM|nr:hypothetical protein [Salinisphaera sp. P385]MDT0619622.1 hypothetical protein [Salinisphaera sp. P385]